MAEQNTGRTEEPIDGNNPKDKVKDDLVRMLEKVQEKQLLVLFPSWLKHWPADSQKW